MEIRTLWKANLKVHKKTLSGIFILIFLLSMSLASVLTVWHHSGLYVDREMGRLGYGTLTAWVSGVSDSSDLEAEILSLDEAETVGIQSLIFSEYETEHGESDSEGQLIVYDKEAYAYHFFDQNLSGFQEAPDDISPGEIYVSASLVSMLGLRQGDTITFPIARSGVEQEFTVAGFYEDPFMGSSMIGMKGFLICGQDYEKIETMIEEAGIDSLARAGYMFHIFQAEDSSLTTSEFNVLLNESTRLPEYMEFSHSFDAISGFMLTLQNVFTGFLIAFAAILLAASMAVLSHSISSSIEQDYRNMGILKTMGYTGSRLRLLQVYQYMLPVCAGSGIGIVLSIPVTGWMNRMMVTTTGLLIPAALPSTFCIPVFAAIFLIFVVFIWFRTKRIDRISPVTAIRGYDTEQRGQKIHSPIHKQYLGCFLALRQLTLAVRRYAGVCMAAVLLVFFASFIGRVNAWLGPDGKGLMDAFNPADLHIAAQPMGETSLEEVEKTIETYTPIMDSYMLAMPGVSVNGIDMTANVITEAERFHMLSGKTCQDAEEVVLTEFAAADFGVSVGDRITITGNLGTQEYRVSGIYQCANDMGMNIGMNREGYQRIAGETSTMWCSHYFIENPDLQPQIMQELEERYGGDVYLHENSWPGLYGILSAMRLLRIFLYSMTICFVFIVTMLTSEKLLQFETWLP